MLLQRLVRDIACAAPGLLHGRAAASAGSPVRIPVASKATLPFAWWQSDMGDGLDITCTIEHEAARELLEIVLGGPPAVTPTPVEQRIVRETVDRLLGVTRRLWEESATAFSATARWECAVDITRGGHRAVLALSAPIVPEPPPLVPARIDLSGIPMKLDVTSAPARRTVEAIGALRPGAVVPLGMPVDSNVILSINGRSLAVCALGATAGVRAVKIAQLAADLRQ